MQVNIIKYLKSTALNPKIILAISPSTEKSLIGFCFLFEKKCEDINYQYRNDNLLSLLADKCEVS